MAIKLLQLMKKWLESWTGFLMLVHPLTKFQIQKCYKEIHSRNNLTKIKDGTYVINLDDHKPIGTYWITLCVNVDNITYFNSIEVD